MQPTNSLLPVLIRRGLPVCGGERVGLVAVGEGEGLAQLAAGEREIRRHHRQGAGGVEIALARGGLLDRVVGALFAGWEELGVPLALVARGGWGRMAVNPQAEVRMTVLLGEPLDAQGGSVRGWVEGFVGAVGRLGLRVAVNVLGVEECVRLGGENGVFKTSLLDARMVLGDAGLFGRLVARVGEVWLGGNGDEFAAERRRELRGRHGRYSRTVFLQEPNVKESCGGLDDYHTLRWVCRAKLGTDDLAELVDAGVWSVVAYREVLAAVDFLHRVRNELHYHTGAPTDKLTLMLQGVVASAFHYPQRGVLRRTEALMRDCYRHTLNLYQHSGVVMEHYRIEEEHPVDEGPRSFLTYRAREEEAFDGFVARDGLLHPRDADVFREDGRRLMRLFQHCQLRQLRMSPRLRQLVHEQLPMVDRAFRGSKANRETFQAILERKGDVAASLRRMHRCGFLGKYLPEFEPLDCLVQHEFFHRYTADEHTLRCVDQLDRLIADPDPKQELFRRLFHEVEDPYAMYLAVLLHDTGRAENVREHIDGSAMLAARLCNRMQIRGARRGLILFLVDNHLTFWRTATTRNLEDPEVIAEFAAIVKTRSNLDALYLFTYADSQATSPESWTAWKASLMLELYVATRRFLDGGNLVEYQRQMEADRLALRGEVAAVLRDDLTGGIAEHFERMPAAAFHCRQAAQIVAQVRTVRQFLQAEAARPDGQAHALRWTDHPGKGYSEMVLATRDRPMLLEKLCRALASLSINILSADFYTRTDGVVVDVFRVCTTDFEPVADGELRRGFAECFDRLLRAGDQEEAGEAAGAGLAAVSGVGGITVPVHAHVSNRLHPSCTTVEIQAMDRIGVLHDVFHAINRHGLSTAHARICTEKGVVMDTFYVTTRDGRKVTDAEVLESLGHDLAVLVGCPEVTG